MSSPIFVADTKIVFVHNFGAPHPWFYSFTAKVI